MSLQIGAKPDHGFDNPTGLLSDCHRRIERFLNKLIHLTKCTSGGELSEEQRHALETSLRYFRKAAPRHTRDEEDSLFPRIRRNGSAEATQVMDLIDSLEGDHREAEALHHIVDTAGESWLINGSLDQSTLTEMGSALSRLRTMYQGHIALEDNQLFPLADRILTAEEIAEVGREMAERRGLDYRQPLRCRTRIGAQ